VNVVVSFDDDFEEAMRDLDSFSSELIKIIENELDRLLRDMEVERVGGSSEADREKFECDATSDNSRFSLRESLDPIEPLRPLRPAPKPRKPLGIPRKALAEMAEPLMDVFDKEAAVEVYVDMPGVEKEDVQVRVRGGRVEVRAGNLRKVIEMPTKEALSHSASSDYRNGVLRIVIPKRLRFRPKDVYRVKRV
jgi:HSP20 family molecular chaperone IbpA